MLGENLPVELVLVLAVLLLGDDLGELVAVGVELVLREHDADDVQLSGHRLLLLLGNLAVLRVELLLLSESLVCVYGV